MKRGFKLFLKIDVPLSKMQEALARALGVANWATLIALEAKAQNIFLPKMLQDNASEYFQNRQFFRNELDAFAGLAEITHRLMGPSDALRISGGPDNSLEDAKRTYADRNFVNRLPNMTTLSEATAEEHELKLARAVLHEGVGLAAIFDTVARGKSLTVPLDLSRGVQEAEVLYLRHRVFTLHDRAKQPYLSMEQVDEAGERVGRRLGPIPLYKADALRRDGALVITQDYRREVWLDLTGFERDEIQALLAFSGLEKSRHGGDRVVY